MYSSIGGAIADLNLKFSLGANRALSQDGTGLRGATALRERPSA